MIAVLQRGLYRLLQTKSQTKILIFDDRDIYAWVDIGNGGEILIVSDKNFEDGTLLCLGSYRMYKVKDEQNLSNDIHLELQVGLGEWQGYILPTGLPTNKKKRSSILATKELVTVFNEAVSSPVFEDHVL